MKGVGFNKLATADTSTVVTVISSAKPESPNRVPKPVAMETMSQNWGPKMEVETQGLKSMSGQDVLKAPISRSRTGSQTAGEPVKKKKGTASRLRAAARDVGILPPKEPG